MVWSGLGYLGISDSLCGWVRQHLDLGYPRGDGRLRAPGEDALQESLIGSGVVVSTSVFEMFQLS